MTESKINRVLSWEFLKAYFCGPVGYIMFAVHALAAFVLSGPLWAPEAVVKEVPPPYLVISILCLIWLVQGLMFWRIQHLMNKQH